LAAEKVLGRRLPVVVSDLKMPGLDGLDLLSKPSAANSTSSTGSSDRVRSLRIMASG
jgi:YesN/AraC family two-component response regulator